MALGMPVLGHHNIVECFGNAVDDRHHFRALGHWQGAAFDEAILHIDHDQHRVVAGIDFASRPGPGGNRSQCAHGAQCGQNLSTVCFHLHSPIKNRTTRA